MTRCIAVAAVLCLSSAVTAAEDLPKLANAALAYWQAFAMMPQLSEDETKRLGEWKTVPLDKSAEDLVAKFGQSLTAMRRGAAVAGCDWGLPYEDGFNMLIPHVAKARDLARAAMLRARLRLSKSDAAGAAADLGDTVAMARHVGSDAVLIGVLVCFAVETPALELAAEHLPMLKSAGLVERLAKLPTGTTAAAAIEMEGRVFADTMIRDLERLARDGGADALRKKVPELLGDARAAAELRKLDADAMLNKFREARALYGRLASAMKLPPEQTSAETKAILDEAVKSNPVAALVLPAVDQVRRAEARVEARRALFAAAAAVLADGPDALAKHPDPFGAGEPFVHRKTDRGFVLESALADRDGKPVQLAVGPAR